MSDAVLVINHYGEVSYFNHAASEIIYGETIDTIGIDKLASTMKLVLNEQIILPYSFYVYIESKGIKYRATVSRLYSFFIVALSIPLVEQQTKEAQLFTSDMHPDSTLILIHDYISTQIKLLSTSFISHSENYPAHYVEEAIRIHQQRIEMLMQVIFSSPSQKKPHLMTEMIREACPKLNRYLFVENIDLSVYRLSENEEYEDFYCKQEWFTLMLMDILDFVTTQKRTKCAVVVDVIQSSHYKILQFSVQNIKVLPIHHLNLLFTRTLEGLDSSDLSKKLNTLPPLTIATFVINKLRGNLKITNKHKNPSLIIKLPVGFHSEEHELLHRQSKLFARELAEIKLNMEH